MSTNWLTHHKAYWVLNNLKQIGPKILNKNNREDSKKCLVLPHMREIHLITSDFVKAFMHAKILRALPTVNEENM